MPRTVAAANIAIEDRIEAAFSIVELMATIAIKSVAGTIIIGIEVIARAAVVEIIVIGLVVVGIMAADITAAASITATTDTTATSLVIIGQAIVLLAEVDFLVLYRNQSILGMSSQWQLQQ